MQFLAGVGLQDAGPMGKIGEGAFRISSGAARRVGAHHSVYVRHGAAAGVQDVLITHDIIHFSSDCEEHVVQTGLIETVLNVLLDAA